MRFLFYILACLFYLAFNPLMAQTKLHVLTKVITNEVDAGNLSGFQITAERADIEVKSWPENKIKYEVRLIAKHPDKETAREDLNRMKFIGEKSGKTFFFRNFLQLERGQEKPESNFSAKYIIYTPARLASTVYNTFGKVEIQDGENVKLYLQFCDTRVSSVSGLLQLKSYFGSSLIENSRGEFRLETDHSDTFLKGFAGDISGKLLYGTFDLDRGVFINHEMEIAAESVVLNIPQRLASKVNLKVKTTDTEVNLLPETLQKISNSSSFELKNASSGIINLNLKSGTLNIQ